MDLLKVRIETERLLLVPVSDLYIDDIFKHFTPEITWYMFPKPPENKGEALQFVKESEDKMRKGQGLFITVLDKETGEFLGGSGLHNLNTRIFEFGIWIKKEAHGKKYGSETVKGLKKWADKNFDFDYFIYPADEDNIPSRKIAESMGGVVHRKYQQISKFGRQLNLVEYKIHRG